MAATRRAAVGRPVSVPVVRLSPRLAWLDTLRLAVCVGVIVHHAAQAYGPTGGAWAVPNTEQAAILGPFLTVDAAFGMGLFFFIAGYFTPQAYERRGWLGFLKERSVRLGVPLLLVSFGALLPYFYLTQGRQQLFVPFLVAYLAHPEVGHMWFVGNLLVCAYGYAAWRALTAKHRSVVRAPAMPPGHRAILGYALGLAGTSFLVRVVSPIDRWYEPLPLLRVEPAHLPQYVSLFALGCVASRQGWLSRLPASTGAIWLRIGLGAATLPFLATLLKRRLLVAGLAGVQGGARPDALLWAVVEGLLCTGLCVGLLTLFRERCDRQAPLLRELAGAAYLVYIIHLPFVLGLQLALVDAPLPPLAKFAAVALTATVLSFVLACALRWLASHLRP